jgi:hypothetical protein
MEKGVTITNGMTLGGEIETTMLRKGPLGVRSTIRSTTNTGKGMKLLMESHWVVKKNHNAKKRT